MSRLCLFFLLVVFLLFGCCFHVWNLILIGRRLCLRLQAELTDRPSRMSRHQVALEDRLGDILSRIAAETQEIKELEQQLTDSEEPSGPAANQNPAGFTLSFNPAPTLCSSSRSDLG